MTSVVERPSRPVRPPRSARCGDHSLERGEVRWILPRLQLGSARWRIWVRLSRLWRRVGLLSRADDSRRCPRWSVMSTSLTTASDGHREHEGRRFDALQHQQPPWMHRSEDAICADAEHLQISSVFATVQLSGRNSGLGRPCATTNPRGRRCFQTDISRRLSIRGCCYGR